MIKRNAREEWKPLVFPGSKQLRKKYAISSHGRAASYSDDIIKDGKVLNGSLTSGYRTLNLHVEDSNGTIYLHREVAKLFITKKTPKAKYVIHVNHIKTDNHYKNLKWCTPEEVADHQQYSPEKIAYKKMQNERTVGLKLNINQVKAIKDTLNNPKRRLTYKQLALKYKVSEMTLYRIRSGENWGRVK